MLKILLKEFLYGLLSCIKFGKLGRKTVDINDIGNYTSAVERDIAESYKKIQQEYERE